MKSKERIILQRLNRAFLTNPLIESNYEYNRFDAENTKYIVEIKSRNNKYDQTIIEFDKFSYNLLYAKENNKFFVYAVKMDDKIYIFNITKLKEYNYNFNWEWREMPKYTEFNNTKNIRKLVGYINIEDATKVY